MRAARFGRLDSLVVFPDLRGDSHARGQGAGPKRQPKTPKTHVPIACQSETEELTSESMAKARQMTQRQNRRFE